MKNASARACMYVHAHRQTDRQVKNIMHLVAHRMGSRGIKILPKRNNTPAHIHPFNGPSSRTTWVSRYQKGKTIRISLKQETVSGSGISWAICKSTPRPDRQLCQHPPLSFFTGGMPFLLPNQQCQNTEGNVPKRNKAQNKWKNTGKPTSLSRGMILMTSPVLSVITMLLPTASIVSMLSTLLQHHQAASQSLNCHQ